MIMVYFFQLKSQDQWIGGSVTLYERLSVELLFGKVGNLFTLLYVDRDRDADQFADRRRSMLEILE